MTFTIFNKQHTIRQVLIVRFNDCVLGNSGQHANPIIAKVDPIPYHSYTHTFMFMNLLKITNIGESHNSQLLIDARN